MDRNKQTNIAKVARQFQNSLATFNVNELNAININQWKWQISIHLYVYNNGSSSSESFDENESPMSSDGCHMIKWGRPSKTNDDELFTRENDPLRVKFKFWPSLIVTWIHGPLRYIHRRQDVNHRSSYPNDAVLRLGTFSSFHKIPGHPRESMNNN